MGIDWEWMLGAEGADLQRAYEDSIPDNDCYDRSDDYDDYEEDEEYEDEEGDIEEEIQQAEAEIEALSQRPIRSLTDEERESLGEHYTSPATSGYIRAVLKGEKNNFRGRDTHLTCEGENYPACDRLFHANSVKTSINFIRRMALFSRKFGEERYLQTVQNSDIIDKEFGVWNDIFFDNVDIPYKSGNNVSAYGPVMFVFKVDILKNAKVRMLKCNPWNRRDEDLKYSDIFFTSSDDIKEGIRSNEGATIDIRRVNFLGDFEHHTTVYDTEELPFGDNLEAIYIEKCINTPGRENELKTLIENALAEAGIGGVPVRIRDNEPSREFIGYATDQDELWEFPNYDTDQVDL
jgi:hypothetical protein